MSPGGTQVKVETRDKLYEGKAKIVYATSRPGTVVQYFKDDATAFNALKRGTIVGKGVVNNRMSAAMFERLERARIPTHYLGTLSDREMLCRRLEIIKIETIVRNIVAGSLAKRTGLEEGTPIRQPIVELYYKSDPLGDPMLNDDHVRMLSLATPAELAWMKRTALRINAVLRPQTRTRRRPRVGKVIEVELPTGSLAEARQRVGEMCRQLLANPILEDYALEMADDLAPREAVR